MGTVGIADLPEQTLLLLDSAPVIHFLEGHPKFMPYFAPVFEAHATGKLRFAVTTITVCEVLTGPLRCHDEAVVSRYRAVFDSWQIVEFDVDIA